MTRPAILLETKPSVFPPRLNCLGHLSSRCFSTDVRAGRWRLIGKGESRHLKTNATEGRMLRISYWEHKTNDYVWQQVIILAGHQELLLPTVKRRELSWFGHVCRHDSLSKIILQGTVDERRRKGRPRKSWKDYIKECTGQSTSSLVRVAEDKRQWAAIIAEASVGVTQRRLGVKGFDWLTDWLIELLL